jgi:type II secretory pathway component GspD/PulD (secretin)
MVFLYQKKSKFRSVLSVCMVLVTAVCAMATIVIAQETPAAADVRSTVEATAVAEPTADNSSGISNQYIAAATSVSTVSVVAAAEIPAAAAVEANAPAPAVEQDQPAPVVVEANAVLSDGAIQSITFKKDMSIRDALRALQANFHRNIVPSQKVDGAIAVTTLYDVTFEDALNAVLGTNFKWEEDGNFIRVYAADEYKKIKTDEGRMQYKIFTLYYVTAEEIKKLLVPITSEKGKVESSSAAEKELSSGGSSSGGGGSSGGSSGSSGELTGGGGGDKMAMHETIVVYDYPENIAKAQDIIQSIDVRPRQVLVEATILSASLTEDMQLGVDLNFMNGISLTGMAGVAGAAGTPIESAGFAGTAKGNGLKVGVTSGDAVAFITALETITDTTIMANPKILAVNKQEGQLHIGDRLGYASQTSQTSGGNTTSEIKFLEVGTMLTFRPYIGNDGYIRMDIYPKDSSGSVDRLSGIPNEQTTQLKTNILVKDGETIVIGGLFRDEVDTIRNQVPILGDIPFFGVLFRSTSDSNKRKEVIVLLTPHIIEAPNQTDAQARLADIERKRYGANRELQWTQRSRLANDWYAAAVEAYSKGEKQTALNKLKLVLELRPTYLEAMQLQEKIVAEVGSADASTTRRIMMERIQAEKSPMWNRP